MTYACISRIILLMNKSCVAIDACYKSFPLRSLLIRKIAVHDFVTRSKYISYFADVGQMDVQLLRTKRSSSFVFGHSFRKFYFTSSDLKQDDVLNWMRNEKEGGIINSVVR